MGLYEEPEKPGNVTEFIKRQLGAPSDNDLEGLHAQNEELTKQIEKLRADNEALKREVEQLRANVA